MSENRVETFPTRSVERARGAARWASWFRPQQARDRADRRDRAIDDAQRVADIKWQWRQACEVSGLGRLVFSPSGPSMTIPLIGRVTLGSPTTFTVRPQPGQLPADFEAAGSRIAAALGVPGIRVRPLAAEWIVIELREAPARPQRAAVPAAAPLRPSAWGHREQVSALRAAA